MIGPRRNSLACKHLQSSSLQVQEYLTCRDINLRLSRNIFDDADDVPDDGVFMLLLLPLPLSYVVDGVVDVDGVCVMILRLGSFLS